jgi:hypothetical protein
MFLFSTIHNFPKFLSLKTKNAMAAIEILRKLISLPETSDFSIKSPY